MPSGNDPSPYPSGQAPRPRIGLGQPDPTLTFALKLSFDSRLIYNRPYLPNLFAPKFIEYILGKGNSLPVYMEAKELPFGVQSKPSRLAI